MTLSRSTLLAVVLAVGVSGLAACGSSDQSPAGQGPAAGASAPAQAAPPAGQAYHDARDGYTFTPPAGWEPQEKSEEYSAMFRSTAPAGNGQQLNPVVLVNVIRTSDPLPAFVAASKRKSAERSTGYHEIADKEVTLADGHTARRVSFTTTESGIGTVHSEQMYVSGQGKVFLVSTTSSQDGYAALAPAIDQSMNSFRAS